ncbi:EcsC family protein [Halobacillus shinanisalinarum]|uniref:EcsC family protein n=1 Tax=Halobacillus shinanisalinarum TaxID=2932258 RepID=A0ABY4GX75_9BACI|nr:EcsC family protein [Halobacillus shinanisalinarum]UOQ92772.1 EcsC family protein [Halobacillus shinanisalinarum]
MSYEAQVYKEAMRWSKSIEKRSSIIQRSSKRIQSSINDRVPERIHTIVTESIRKMIELALTSSQYIRPIEIKDSWIFKEREELVTERLKQYKNTASWEGAGTGFGGFWLGAVDFPLLLSIKMKFLFDAAQYYGLNVDDYEERVYLLYIFMLAFSSDQEKTKVRDIVLNWRAVPTERKKIDWKTLQIEYRDTIDLAKLLQLVPGFGAIVGYVANKRFLEQLGETTMNAYRLRLLQN